MKINMQQDIAEGMISLQNNLNQWFQEACLYCIQRSCTSYLSNVKYDAFGFKAECNSFPWLSSLCSIPYFNYWVFYFLFFKIACNIQQVQTYIMKLSASHVGSASSLTQCRHKQCQVTEPKSESSPLCSKRIFF